MQKPTIKIGYPLSVHKSSTTSTTNHSLGRAWCALLPAPDPRPIPIQRKLWWGNHQAPRGKTVGLSGPLLAGILGMHASPRRRRRSTLCTYVRLVGRKEEGGWWADRPGSSSSSSSSRTTAVRLESVSCLCYIQVRVVAFCFKQYHGWRKLGLGSEWYLMRGVRMLAGKKRGGSLYRWRVCGTVVDALNVIYSREKGEIHPLFIHPTVIHGLGEDVISYPFHN